MKLSFKTLGVILLLEFTMIGLITNNKKNHQTKLNLNVEAICTGETDFDPKIDCQSANSICIKIMQDGKLVKYNGVRTFIK